MKNRLVKIAVATILLVSVLLNLSCSNAPQYKTAVNIPANNSVVQGNANQDEAGEKILAADCSGDAPAKKQKIKNGIEGKINGYSSLKKQFKKRFDFEPVVESNGDVVLYFWGNVFTSVQNLNQLNKTYEGYVNKQCVTKVVFDKAPDKTELNPGFEFELCEYPNQVCGDGTCRQVCPSITGNENTKTNSNANR